MIAKDGYKIISYTAVLAALLAISAWFTQSAVLWILCGLTVGIFVFHFFFFRDPERTIPEGKQLILSPADGTVIKIDEFEEPHYIQDKALRVCIFMSVFNAHINRNPVSGTVEYCEHKKGKFLVAFDEQAPEVNEHTNVGINTEFGKVFFKQIAGLIARRIVCRLNKSDNVKSGERFGMIKYSSRVDLFLPLGTKLDVKVKDRVKAGISIIGEFAS